MDPTPVPLERRRRPLLYGALVTGTLAAVAAAGWVLLSPSPLLHRQVAAGTTQPTESMSRPASDAPVQPAKLRPAPTPEDRKSTRLNSSHEWISYAVFCLKKKK